MPRFDISEAECSALIRESARHPTPMRLALTPGRGPGRTAMLDTELDDWTTRALVELRVCSFIANVLNSAERKGDVK